MTSFIKKRRLKNGLYEYLYAMKYQKNFDGKAYLDGIPEEKYT